MSDPPSTPIPGRTRIRERVLAGETLIGSFAMLASPLSAEILGRAGFDWLIIDLEHGAGGEADLLAHIHAVETTPAAALVRPQSTERLRVGRALDYGAEGVMIPRLETVEEVREAVSYLRFPPVGVRGVALLTRGAGLNETPHAGVQNRNSAFLGVFQVESPGAVENADEIAAIEGVDVLFVGPADLSHSLGIPGQFTNPRFQESLARVVQATNDHGKAAGILIRSGADLERHLDLGFRFIGIGSDGNFVVDGATAALDAVKARGGP